MFWVEKVWMIIFNICFGYIVWSHNIPKGYCVSSSCRYDMHVQYACHANENKPKLINHHKHQTSMAISSQFNTHKISERDKTEVMSRGLLVQHACATMWLHIKIDVIGKKGNHLITKLSNHSKFGWGGFFIFIFFFPLWVS